MYAVSLSVYMAVETDISYITRDSVWHFYEVNYVYRQSKNICTIRTRR